MRKKVLMCIPSLGAGDGVMTCIMSFYDYLLQHEYEVDFLLVIDKSSEKESYVLEKGSKVFKVPMIKKYDRKRIDYIDNVFKNNKYDIVHVNFPGPNGAMVLKMANKHRVKHRIYHCHNPFNKLSLKAILSESVFTPLCRKRANKYVACSSLAGQSIFGDKEFEVINNAINPNNYLFDSEARKKIRESLDIDRRLIIGVAARMNEQKNPGFIIEVFDEIRSLNENALLLWVGDGSERAQIQKLCHEKNIEKDVLLVGRQSDIVEWYSAMDLFLLPSKFEGLGIVYLEAQANGLHCFGSDRVPKETEVTELMHRLSLDKSAQEWAAEMLKVFGTKADSREVDIDLFKKSGYDIRFAESKLYDMYETFYNKQE